MTSDVRAPPPGRSLGPLAVLQQRDFRLLCAGLLVSQTGSRVQQLAQNWLLWELTHSPLALGVYGLCRSLPFLLVSLYAGVLADRTDRRWLLVWSNAASILFPLLLGTIVALGRV